MKSVRILRWMICIGVLAAFSAQAQEETKISDLEWMVGDWRAVDKSDQTVVRLNVHEAENHQAIVFRVWTESKGRRTPKYNGMYYWHPQEKTYKLLQVDDKGNVAEGTYEQTGNRVVQLVKVASEKGDVEIRSEWEIRPKEFHFVGQFRPAGKGEWQPALDITYSRMAPVD